MPAKPFKRAVAVTGTYESQGQTKKRYTNVGTLFQYDDGGFSLKLEAVPVGSGFDGWISFFDIEDKRDAGRQQSRQSGRGDSFQADTEIPF